ncbi:MAG: hypothetical protein KGI54_14330 [Pseudomonadota bacterium]|nr:hypothetical protein [Pseudomonadota bacterium]
MTLTNLAQHAKRIIAKHVLRHTITEEEIIPEHDLRKASEEYLANRKKLIIDEQIPCWMCGTKENLEAHHWFEWAEWKNEDPKAASDILARLNFHGYGHLAAEAPIDGADHIANLCVLCVRDHRGKGFGIHNTTGPVWWARKAAQAGVAVVQEVK